MCEAIPPRLCSWAMTLQPGANSFMSFAWSISLNLQGSNTLIDVLHYRWRVCQNHYKGTMTENRCRRIKQLQKLSFQGLAPVRFLQNKIGLKEGEGKIQGLPRLRHLKCCNQDSSSPLAVNQKWLCLHLLAEQVTFCRTRRLKQQQSTLAVL